VNQAAQRDKRTRFTALLHYVDVERLRRVFTRLRRNATAGVDGETVAHYERNLEDNLRALCARVHSGHYRPFPVRRVYIPKRDGSQRPLGIPALEDKIVQGAVAEVLQAIYETDFVNCSYGFRPGRNAHQALDALHTGIMAQCVNWVLDADIRRFFDSVDHEWLLWMVAQRIADPRVIRLIQQWLTAGVLESDEWQPSETGTPQGSAISPLLANIVLHYALDIWATLWIRNQARGMVPLIRYADDFVIGFQYRSDALAMMAALTQRLGKFGLSLQTEKTWLIEFGRLPALDHARRGEKRLATFNFLGFTPYCGGTRDGRFVVKRKTQSQRITRKLKGLRAEARRRMHEPVAQQHTWLCQVLRGHNAYYGLPCNIPSLKAFLWQVRRIWYHVLQRRERTGRFTWQRFLELLTRLPLPTPTITHPCSPVPAALG
jgi:group II intron reverse transcriptase/maturase